MTELARSIQEPEKSAIVHATDLLTHYSFDLGDRTVSQLTQHWLKDFSANWIRSAVIEALYQGRYKAVSVDQILLLWKRRSQPCYHFNYEFERLVCNKFPRDLSQKPRQVLAIASNNPQPIEAAPILTPENAEEPIPAWAALAEQIQRDELSELGSEGLVNSDQIAAIEANEFKDIELSDPLIEKVEEEVNGSIEQTAANFNISKRLTEEFEALDLSLMAAIVEVEELQPPIHQFTPPPNGSDFHSKLKAVAESGGEQS
ncbi:hypothetical protein C7B65_14630 [Phormidesmis priestleyi ULC007]|uniref:Uncharacterized protein n=2 Tax=Phormidesmis priestleyi TaxID=268141 RepID=A0A2T1DDK3_9CYAN|nr:hypothetical protein C7B65_14630 [Phormidesmis priestleyi ULC007]PZO49818.1 MAG: hypothetical protein DCF14_13450 [Phormidesmis priestleyi]